MGRGGGNSQFARFVLHLMLITRTGGTESGFGSIRIFVFLSNLICKINLYLSPRYLRCFHYQTFSFFSSWEKNNLFSFSPHFKVE